MYQNYFESTRSPATKFPVIIGDRHILIFYIDMLGNITYVFCKTFLPTHFGDEIDTKLIDGFFIGAIA